MKKRERLYNEYTFLIKEVPLSSKEKEFLVALSKILGNKKIATIFYNYFRGNLYRFFQFSEEDFYLLPSIKKKHVEIIMALKVVIENILKSSLPLYTYRLNSPELVYNFILPYILKEDREIFLGIPLNSSLIPITSPVIISIGSPTESIVDPAYYYKIMIRLGAVCSIAVHNHPSSGDPKPSKEDIETTKVLLKIGELLNIPLKDHIIIGESGFFSFAASGKLTSS